MLAAQAKVACTAVNCLLHPQPWQPYLGIMDAENANYSLSVTSPPSEFPRRAHTT